MSEKFVIACYSIDGKFIKTYPSAKKAAVSLHLFSRTIDKCIREGNGLIHNKQWRRYKVDEVPLFIEPYQKKKASRKARPIALLDDNNIVIKVYSSISEAAKENDVDNHTIRDVLNGKSKTAKGKRYRYFSS